MSLTTSVMPNTDDVERSERYQLTKLREQHSTVGGLWGASMILTTMWVVGIGGGIWWTQRLMQTPNWDIRTPSAVVDTFVKWEYRTPSYWARALTIWRVVTLFGLIGAMSGQKYVYTRFLLRFCLEIGIVFDLAMGIFHILERWLFGCNMGVFAWNTCHSLLWCSPNYKYNPQLCGNNRNVLGNPPLTINSDWYWAMFWAWYHFILGLTVYFVIGKIRFASPPVTPAEARATVRTAWRWHLFATLAYLGLFLVGVFWAYRLDPPDHELVRSPNDPAGDVFYSERYAFPSGWANFLAMVAPVFVVTSSIAIVSNQVKPLFTTAHQYVLTVCFFVYGVFVALRVFELFTCNSNFWWTNRCNNQLVCCFNDLYIAFSRICGSNFSTPCDPPIYAASQLKPDYGWSVCFALEGWMLFCIYFMIRNLYQITSFRYALDKAHSVSRRP